MTKNTIILMSGLVILGISLATGSLADEKATTAAESSSPSEEEIAESLKKLVFVPHDQDAPAVTDTGGVRAVTIAPKVELLAPERIARTLSPTPTLYWHISKASAEPVRFTLITDDVEAIAPLLEFEIGAIDGEGIYGVDLGDHDLTLENGERYIWSIALASDGGRLSDDLIARTVMEYRGDPDLAGALDGVRADERVVLLAAKGYWYDAVNALSAQIDASSDPSRSWQTARGRLLDQAGLTQAARYDQRQASE